MLWAACWPLTQSAPSCPPRAGELLGRALTVDSKPSPQLGGSGLTSWCCRGPPGPLPASHEEEGTCRSPWGGAHGGAQPGHFRSPHALPGPEGRARPGTGPESSTWLGRGLPWAWASGGAPYPSLQVSHAYSTPMAGAPAAHSPCTPGGHLRKPLPTLSSAFSLVNWGREVAGGDCAGPAPLPLPSPSFPQALCPA